MKWIIFIVVLTVISCRHNKRKLKKQKQSPTDGTSGSIQGPAASNENIWLGSCLISLLESQQTDNFDMCICTYNMAKNKDGERCKIFIGKEIQMNEIKDIGNGQLQVEIHKLEGQKCDASCKQLPFSSGKQIMEEMNNQMQKRRRMKKNKRLLIKHKKYFKH